MNKFNLSKREKFLVYILTLVLAIFIYINFIREPILVELNSRDYTNPELISDTYDEILLINSNISEELNLLKETENLIALHHNDFGSNIDTKAISDELGLKVNNISISRIMKEEHNGLDAYYIQSSTQLEGDIDEIYNYLKRIYDTECLYIYNAKLTRIDREKLGLDITLREYTLVEIPYTGVVSRDNYQDENSVNHSNLMNSLYGSKDNTEKNEEEKASSSTSTNSYSAASRKNNSSQNSVSNNNINDEIQKSNFESHTQELDDLVVDENSRNIELEFEKFNIIDMMKPITIGQSFLRNYVADWDIDLLLNSNYYEENEKTFLGNPDLIETFKVNKEKGEVEIVIDGDLNLKEAPIVIPSKADLFILEFNISEGGRIFIDFKTSRGEFISTELVKQFEDWQTMEFGIPIESSEYPLEIVGFRSIVGVGDSIGNIRNFAILKKK